MKKQLLLSAITLFLSTFSFAQHYGWKDISANVPGNTNTNLSDVFFVSDTEGWIISSIDNEIYHTTDGGNTFEVQTTTYHCYAIHMIDENEGYAGGWQARVYRTTDGGDHWIAIGSIGETLTDISFPPSGDTGYACGLNGRIAKITPSEVTIMTSHVPDSFDGISFPVSSDEGWVCGSSVMRHYADNDWNGDQYYPYGGYNDICMVDNLTGWAAGTGGIIIHTTDGHNWFKQTSPTDETFYKIYFLNKNEGWAVGSHCAIIHTTNGGETWVKEAEGLVSTALAGVHFTSSTNGYAVGTDKTVLKYGEISGIEDNVENVKFEIYPNPAGDEFKVQSLPAGKAGLRFKVSQASLQLFDLNGRKLLEKQIPKGSEEATVDVSRLQNGLYFCRIRTEKGSGTKKLIIQK